MPFFTQPPQELAKYALISQGISSIAGYSAGFCRYFGNPRDPSPNLEMTKQLCVTIELLGQASAAFLFSATCSTLLEPQGNRYSSSQLLSYLSYTPYALFALQIGAKLLQGKQAAAPQLLTRVTGLFSLKPPPFKEI